MARALYGRPTWQATSDAVKGQQRAHAPASMRQSAEARTALHPSPHSGRPEGAPVSAARSSNLTSIPTTSQYLLLASFIASYNPQSTDVRLLCTSQSDGKRRRLSRKAPKPGQSAKVSNRPSLSLRTSDGSLANVASRPSAVDWTETIWRREIAGGIRIYRRCR